jgi:hypothetical protein
MRRSNRRVWGSGRRLAAFAILCLITLPAFAALSPEARMAPREATMAVCGRESEDAASRAPGDRHRHGGPGCAVAQCRLSSPPAILSNCAALETASPTASVARPGGSPTPMSHGSRLPSSRGPPRLA